MQETFFTSSVMMGFFNFIKEIGLLNFIAGGIAVMAFGYGYHQLHPNATVAKSRNWSGIGLILSRVILGSILFVIGGLNCFRISFSCSQEHRAVYGSLVSSWTLVTSSIGHLCPDCGQHRPLPYVSCAIRVGNRIVDGGSGTVSRIPVQRGFHPAFSNETCAGRSDVAASPKYIRGMVCHPLI